MAQRPDRRHHSLVLGYMVGAENVDNDIESASELFDVVGDIGRAIRWLARPSRPHQHEILRQSQRLASKPYRTLIFAYQPAGAEPLDNRIYLAAANQVEFVREYIEANTQPLASVSYIGKYRFFGRRPKCLECPGFVIQVGQRVSIA